MFLTGLTKTASLIPTALGAGLGVASGIARHGRDVKRMTPSERRKKAKKNLAIRVLLRGATGALMGNMVGRLASKHTAGRLSRLSDTDQTALNMRMRAAKLRGHGKPWIVPGEGNA